MHIDTVKIGQNSKPVAHLDALDELKSAWQKLGIHQPHPVIVVIGGAGGMSDDDLKRIRDFFKDQLFPFAEKMNAVIVDGGTDSGVMSAVGLARKALSSEVPAVGIYARNIKGVSEMLEPNHSHFISCPGSDWGDESEYIAAAADVLSGDLHTVAVLINGGQITWNDARFNIQYGSPVVVAEGSGRTADAIAVTSSGRDFDSKAMSLIRTGKVHVANFFKDPEGFIRKMESLMK